MRPRENPDEEERPSKRRKVQELGVYNTDLSLTNTSWSPNEEDQDESWGDEDSSSGVDKETSWMDPYRDYWLGRYGSRVTPTMAAGTRAFLERKHAKEGGTAGARSRLGQELADKIAARRLAEAAALLRASLAMAKCENKELSPRQQRHHPVQTIRLVVPDAESPPGRHVVCYDAVALRTHLAHGSKSSQHWADPTFGQRYTAKQRADIQARANRFSGCDPSRFDSYAVVGDGALAQETATVPGQVYERLVGAEPVRGATHLIIRVTNPATHESAYAAVVDQHSGPDQTLRLATGDMARLGLSQEDLAIVEECPQLPKIQRVFLQPQTLDWNELNADDMERLLTRDIENRYVLSTGDVIAVSYQGRDYPVLVRDLWSNGRRVAAGITKFTNVDVEFQPAVRASP